MRSTLGKKKSVIGVLMSLTEPKVVVSVILVICSSNAVAAYPYFLVASSNFLVYPQPSDEPEPTQSKVNNKPVKD